MALKLNHPRKVLQIIDAAVRLLHAPESWTRYTMARDGEQRPTAYAAADAKMYCLAGALYRAGTNLNLPPEITDEAKSLLNQVCISTYGPIISKHGAEENIREFHLYPLSYTNDTLIINQKSASELLKKVHNLLGKLVVEQQRAAKPKGVPSSTPAPAQPPMREASIPAPAQTPSGEAEAPIPAPVQTPSEEAEAPTPAPVQTPPEEAEAPIPAPVQAPPEEAPIPLPVQAPPEEAPTPAPVQASPEEAPIPLPVQASPEEAPTPAPVQASPEEAPIPLPVQAPPEEAPIPLPVQASSEEAPDPAGIPDQSAQVPIEGGPEGMDMAQQPVQHHPTAQPDAVDEEEEKESHAVELPKIHLPGIEIDMDLDEPKH